MDLDKLHAMAATMANLPGEVRATITSTITHTFTLSLLVVVAALVATMLVPSLPLRAREQKAASQQPQAQPS
jgi:hypothetical protein